MLSKSSQSCTPSPHGYSPCLGESADAHIECIHSVKADSTVPLRGGRARSAEGVESLDNCYIIPQKIRMAIAILIA